VFKQIVRRWVEGTSPSTDQTAAETRRIAEDALRVSQSLKDEVQKLVPKNETPRRFALLAIATVLCASGVIASFVLMQPGFGAPPPNYGVPGIVGLYVWSNPLNAGQTQALSESGVSLRASVDQRSPRVEYVASFPKALAGDRFVIGLAGAAVLSDFDSSVADADNEYPPCQLEHSDQQASCQLVTGIIPFDSDEPLACRDGGGVEMVSVRFSGDTAGVNSSYDWAHHVTSIPYLGNLPETGSGSVDGIVTGTYGDNFVETNLTTCYNLLLNPAWTDFTPNFEPTLHVGDTMMWDPASNRAGYLVVSTERSAAWKGNALLGLFGVFGGALLTLLVATARSCGRLRSQARGQQT
jgi:hypothetical protein